LLENLKLYLSRSDLSHHMLQTHFKELLQLWTKTLRRREGGGSLAGVLWMRIHQVPVLLRQEPWFYTQMMNLQVEELCDMIFWNKLCAWYLYAMRIFSFIHTCHTFTGVTDEWRIYYSLCDTCVRASCISFNDLGFQCAPLHALMKP
jgi:hypothetical protein